ncbi:flavin-dependent monooxygenase QhpG [Actinokineospora sp. NPDC004072]
MIDVCVIGGGPAGSTCARRLAQLGHAVVLVERRAFPRPRIGEALTPGVRPLLDVLGVATPVMPSAGALVRWADATTRLVPARPAHPPVVVDRGRFDLDLLAAARVAGVDVRQPERAYQPRRADGGWEVPLRQGRVRARFVVDASGRGRVLGGQVQRTGAKTWALHAAFPGGGLPRVEALPQGWCWSAPLPGGLVRAMALTDPGPLREVGVDRLFRDLLDAARMPVDPAARVEVCDATAYAAVEPVTADSIRIGEAAFALDPLSSSGVDKAMQSALAAAVTVHTLLTEGADHAAAVAYYRDSHRRTVDQHARWTADFYSQHRAYADQPFWRARSAPSPQVEQVRPVPADLMERRISLAPAAALVPTPCPDGDLVTVRRALTHPALPAPIAYVDGVELAPLLDRLPSGAQLAEVVRAWSGRLAPDRAVAVARWLYRRGLVEAHWAGGRAEGEPGGR